MRGTVTSGLWVVTIARPEGQTGKSVRDGVPRRQIRAGFRAVRETGRPELGAPRFRSRDGGQAAAAAVASWMFFTMFGSTGTPGPIVVVTVIFLMYLPFAADGFARSTSSRTAA